MTLPPELLRFFFTDRIFLLTKVKKSISIYHILKTVEKEEYAFR